MSVLQNLLIDNLKLRGLGNSFNGFGRFFANLDQAKQAIATGDYDPVEGEINAVIVGGQGIMVYSFDLNDFVLVSDLIAASNQANKYIELDGANDYIEFTTVGASANNVLDFTQDWSVGITLVGVTGPSSAKKMTLFSRGGLHITLNAQAGSSNWGLYVTSNNDLYNTDKRAQANTWYAPSDFSRLLFTYNATTKRLKYFIGDPATGTYAQRANLAIPQTMVDGQDITGGICIGKSWSGTGGSTFSGINWDGGLNNFVCASMELTGPQLVEYFQTQATDPDNPSDAFSELELYPDLNVYAKLGEDTYPNVTDEKGNLTGGSLVNGSEDDFIDIPTA